jgi:ribosomal protein S18 acetylase RimI-like enzyme
VDGEPAGSTIWHRSFSTNRGEEVMYLQDIAVLPQFRRMGVGKLLLLETCKLAVTKGYSKVYWLALDWNEGALSLYRSIGASVETGNSYCALEDDALRRFATTP